MATVDFIFYRKKEGDEQDNVLVLNRACQKECEKKTGHDYRVRSCTEGGWRHVCKWCGVSSR